MSANETGMPLGDTPNIVTPHQDDTDTGSLRDICRKSSDFTVRNNKVVHEYKSYEKARRYAKLRLAEMFTSLTALYVYPIAAHWSHFKRIADAANVAQGVAQTGQDYLARVYISHWMLDLYAVVRNSTRKLTPVAYAQHFRDGISLFSNEYDDFLVYLLDSIRPTHVVGCHEDQMFIPKFEDEFDMTNKNPFGLENFAYDTRSFFAFINLIKDKRVGWKISKISNDAVGRPLWLFDWHNDGEVCSWFPREGNYTSHDVVAAYIVGVACTPKLAHVESDNWVEVLPNIELTNNVLAQIRRVVPRSYFANYEVELFETFTADFVKTPSQEELTAAHRAQRTGAKRARTDPREGDRTQPAARGKGPAQEEPMEETKTFKFVRRRTYLYYNRVITQLTDDCRITALMGLLYSPDSYRIY